MDEKETKIEMLNTEVKKLNETIAEMHTDLAKIRLVLVFMERRLTKVETQDKDLEDYAQQLFDAHS